MQITKELYGTAAISSVIIAFYGVIPFYVFDRPATLYSLRMFLGLSGMFFIAWLILFFLIQRFPRWNGIKLFFVSFFCNVLVRFLLAGLGLLDFFPVGFSLDEFIYFVSTLLPINATLIIILKSTLIFLEKTEAERQLQAAKLQNAEAQTKILMQQLKPHFLFNSLNVLKSLISEDPQKAEDYVVKLSEFLRYSIEAASYDDRIILERELYFVTGYIELQKERFEDAFTYFIAIDNSFMKTKIPVMALQTIVENIFKHNYFTKQNPLHFTIGIENDFLVIENTKNAIQQTDSTKTGLNSLQKSYELIGAKDMIVKETQEHFCVKLPLLYI